MRKRFETYLQYCLSFQTCHVLLISRVLSFLFSMQLVIELGNSEVKRLRESIQQLKFMLRSEVATNDHDGHHDEWEDETSFETMGNEVIEKSGLNIIEGEKVINKRLFKNKVDARYYYT